MVGGFGVVSELLLSEIQKETMMQRISDLKIDVRPSLDLLVETDWIYVYSDASLDEIMTIEGVNHATSCGKSLVICRPDPRYDLMDVVKEIESRLSPEVDTPDESNDQP